MAHVRAEVVRRLEPHEDSRGAFRTLVKLLGFLSSEDHVANSKKLFLESLEELREIKGQYPRLPWGDPAVTDV
jgi:hypothetical protein